MNQEFDKVRRLFMKPFKPKSAQPPPPLPVQPAVQQTAHTTKLQPKFVVPPVPHPCPHDQLSILASPGGLLIRPTLHNRVKPESHIRIAWGKDGLVEEIQDSGDNGSLDWAEAVVIHGIVGMLTLYTGIVNTFDLVLALNEMPLPTVTSAVSDAVDSTFPEDEDSAASAASSPRVKFAAEDQVKLMTPKPTDGFDLPPEDDDTPPSPASAASTPSSEYSVNTGNIAKVLADKLSFWSRLSTRQNTKGVSAHEAGQAEALLQEETDERAGALEAPVSLDDIIQDGSHEPAEVIEEILSATAPAPSTIEEKHNELEDKIIRDCVREYTRGVMFFAYTFDITRSLQYKQELIANAKRKNALLADLNALEEEQILSPPGDKIDILAEPNATLPLWRRVDRQYWWNEWLSKPFVDAGVHSYILPVMQGFCQIASFAIPREPVAGEEGDAAIVDYVIVSRRSRDRAGLRYQRRGIDDDANVANFVETETVMRVEREAFVNVFSHIQIRGSIPLFWAQTGYGLKPPPVLSADRTRTQNVDAMRRHFTKTLHRYGPHTIVNLAEQHGKEGAVTGAYGQYVQEIGSRDVQYCEYDFHKETKGMKYENISHLIEKMERTFESQGYLWVSNGSIMSLQKGVFRVNCIDCLDRTNVVESAFARYVLQRQLGAVALLPNSDMGRTEAEIVFNDVWANNGDAVSRAYAGTSALKGDFTRTGKRDLTGLLNDGVNSLARMYTSTFGDWFNQAVIDFMLGNRTLSVFSEFLLRLQSSDPSELIRISKIRAEAIATSVARVLEDGERLLSGWTLFAPVDMNTKVGRVEEKVLLLSVRALYIISYDYTLEKVKMYTRVPLGDVVSVTQGAYILSPLEEGSRDPNQNAGFVVTWRNTNQDTRVTSYSIRNSLETPPSSPGPNSGTPGSPRTVTAPRLSRAPTRKATALSRILSNAAAPVLDNDVTFAAFKALPIDPARSRRENGSFVEPADELTGATNCKEAVALMVEAIRRACADIGNDENELVKQKDVVSLVEAQRMTSVYSKMEYGVKRLLWLGG
ncbi:hypothetical protein EIP91_004492 [Steccherinum ochraceum]|uniref:Phosphatidylinositide phosphatase SAC2 n=1 Tax=Steccherinum ochraceum TaxID=92696 RepID=A0A4R0RBU2_9APHY|nr:hypothetical protein EIP91_004492 [Steccherinum ochraceum]